MLPAHKNIKGIGLVEVIASLGVAVVVLTSLVSLSLFSMRSSLNSRLQLEGTKLANKQLEFVRALRDSSPDWSNGTDGFLDQIIICTSSNPCYMSFAGGLIVTPGTLVQGAGAETVTISFSASDIDGTALVSTDERVRVTVVVSWAVGNQTKYARLYTDYTNWSNR